MHMEERQYQHALKDVIVLKFYSPLILKLVIRLE